MSSEMVPLRNHQHEKASHQKIKTSKHQQIKKQHQLRLTSASLFTSPLRRENSQDWIKYYIKYH